MPPKDHNPMQLFLKTEIGEYQPMGTTIEECADIVSGVDNALRKPEYFKGGGITFKISRKESKRMKKVFQSVCIKYFTNNWRKMHHLPMVNRMGKRK